MLHGFRAGSGSRPRVLYWFRTPPNVKVGRLPLDEEAIRAVEEHNPHITFDWKKMLRVRPKPPPAAPADREGSAGRSQRSPGPRRTKTEPAPGAAPAVVAAVEAVGQPIQAADDEVEARDVAEKAADGPDESVDAAAFIAELDADREPVDDQLATDDPAWEHPVVALLGDDGLARLRASYAELRARVADSRAEPATREAMAARIEALDPDSWRAGEEVVLAIERFGSEAEAIKHALGRRRRRVGRTGDHPPPDPAPEGPPDADA